MAVEKGERIVRVLYMQIKRRSLIFAGVFVLAWAALRLTGVLWHSFQWPAAGVILFLLSTMEITIPSKRGILRHLAVLLCSVLLSFVLFLCAQYTCGNYGVDLLPSSFSIDFPVKLILYNTLTCMLLQYFFLVLCNNLVAASVATAVVWEGFFIANLISLNLRSSTILFRDFTAIGTAISVLDNYTLPNMQNVIQCVFLLTLIIACFGVLHFAPKARRWRDRVVSLGMLGALIVLLLVCSRNHKLLTWMDYPLLENGLPYNTFLSVRDSRVSRPEGYDRAAVEALAEEYAAAPATETAIVPQNIIVIMSEAFSDISLLGNLDPNADPLENYHALCENTIKGFCLTPAFASNTCNPEWEFLTGGSLAFFRAGAYPFQQYVEEGDYSIVGHLKSHGYTTVGIHPYSPKCWDRSGAYENFGFDEKMFESGFSESRRVRDYVSDEALYNELLRRIAEKPAGEKLFLFAVSMQNHGGYEAAVPELSDSIRSGSMAYHQLDNYLTLLRETDRANAALLAALREVEEPTLVLLFGDHQPYLPDAFYDEIFAASGETDSLAQSVLQHHTPFFLWANYPLAAQESELLSVSFLPALLLETAGLDDAPYFRFLNDLRQQIPAIYPEGYYSRTAGAFLPLSEAAGEEAAWLSRYEMLQYNALFDGKGRNPILFGQG